VSIPTCKHSKIVKIGARNCEETDFSEREWPGAFSHSADAFHEASKGFVWIYRQVCEHLSSQGVSAVRVNGA